MRYLVRLITPKNGIVLDPFAGSGSTLIGAMLEGFYYLGIDSDKNSINITNQRLEDWKDGDDEKPPFYQKTIFDQNKMED